MFEELEKSHAYSSSGTHGDVNRPVSYGVTNANVLVGIMTPLTGRPAGFLPVPKISELRTYVRAGCSMETRVFAITLGNETTNYQPSSRSPAQCRCR